MQISILRLGHRLPRDERISTHVCLVARAFGADEVIYTGQHDGSLESSVLRLVGQWGGTFSIKHAEEYGKVINGHKKNGFVVMHLTMYGMPLPEVLNSEPWVSEINTGLGAENSKLLVIIGGEQVPKDVYEMADFNIAVTSQPHSEVAALAVFLDHLQESKPLERDYAGRFKGKIRIEPSERGKRMKTGY